MLTPPLWQRLLAALAYLLPWASALPFGQSLFHVFPILNWVVLPALPVLFLERAVPFGGFVLFLVLFLVQFQQQLEQLLLIPQLLQMQLYTLDYF